MNDSNLTLTEAELESVKKLSYGEVLELIQLKKRIQEWYDSNKDAMDFNIQDQVVLIREFMQGDTK